MTQVLLTLALLACPLVMGAMMWFMMRGNKGSVGGTTPTASTLPDTELVRLRSEVDQLRAAHQAESTLSSVRSASDPGVR